MLHEMPVPVGSASESVADLAVPGPALLTWMVKPMLLPASTVAASAVLLIERLGQFTTTCAEDWAEPSLLVVTFAVFEIVAQLADVVAETTCTDADAPVASDPKLHVSTPLEMEQPLTAGLIDQLSPVFDGRLSVTVTPVAVPEPLLLAVIVKPI